MKDVISATKCARFLYGYLVTGSLHHTDDAVSPALVKANGAWITVSKVAANGTEPDHFLYIYKALGKALGQFLVASKDMKCNPCSRFLSDSR